MKNKLSEIFVPAKEATTVIKSAKKAISTILEMGPEVLQEHKRTLLSRMLWKITEAHGKYTTRYCSKDARDGAPKLQHDHVTTRKELIDRLLQTPSVADRVLEDAIGCTVTVEEHKELSSLPDKIRGWDRYKEARIRVYDRLEDTFIN